MGAVSNYRRSIGAEKPIILGAFQTVKYDNVALPMTGTTPQGFGGFYNDTVTFLPRQNGAESVIAFNLATSGQADEGFDIGGILEEYTTITVTANNKVIAQVTGYAGYFNAPILQVRCGQQLASRPKRYQVRIYKSSPPNTGNIFYYDYLETFTRATY